MIILLFLLLFFLLKSLLENDYRAILFIIYAVLPIQYELTIINYNIHIGVYYIFTNMCIFVLKVLFTIKLKKINTIWQLKRKKNGSTEN